jgi:hypothetical protein
LAATRGGQESIWEDIMFDIAEINKSQESRYLIRHRKGVFYLDEVSNQTQMWAFEVGSNIFSAELKQTIENYYNQIYVISTEETLNESLLGFDESGTSLDLSVAGFAQNDFDFTRYGRHVLTVNEETGIGVETAQQQADNLLRKHNKVEQELTLSAYNINGLKWGDKIVLYEPDLNRSGVCWIRGGRHRIAEAEVMMELDVAFDYVLPEEVRNVQLETGLDGLIGFES